ncbi:MAG: adenylate/guanylate cyclase domain-containing protein [Pirellulaceae bacterium]|nr:adenylate/guanylate cyclase domain-containing protein [Planctomycetales bacterium]
MSELIAQGENPASRWRRTVPPDRKLILGRTAGVWATPWDDLISRQHVEMRLNKGRLEVRRLPQARNPVFVRGRQVDHVWIRPGEHFVIGNTTFTLSDEQVDVASDDPTPMTQQHYSRQYLQQVRYRNADQRIEALSRLPEVIHGAANDTELFVRLVNVLMTGIRRSDAVAIVHWEEDEPGREKIDVLHWDRRLASGVEFRPSQRLIREAIQRRESVVHLWQGAGDQPSRFTQREDVDWAFCTPVPGDNSAGWAIYVTGHFSGKESGTPDATDPHDLRDDLKFTELAAATLNGLREARFLQRSQASLGQFFSPLVLAALEGEDPDVVLAPREAVVSVLFCDLRGFSRQSERAADDLLGLLQRVSEALGVMTRHILRQGGVVGDFHGDAAMGFWGWPIAQDDAAVRACHAALGIRDEFLKAAQRTADPLTDFRIGIGIATGLAVAGKIGTVDQVKVTVFGPVVNLASRLEGMTKLIRAPILMDEDTADRARRMFSKDEARVRKIAVVRPYGMAQSLEVSELLPPEKDYPILNDEHLLLYEQALAAMQEGDWPYAYSLLSRVPTEDQVKDFLTIFIAQHNRTAPANWDGVIPLESK